MTYQSLDWWAETHGLHTPAEIDERIRTLYRQHRSCAKVGECLDISGNAVRYHLHQMGEPLRKRGGANNPSGSQAHRRITWQGRDWTIREAADHAGVAYETMRRRLVDWGWSVERALTTPPIPGKYRRNGGQR
jgi:hypothetical protein